MEKKKPSLIRKTLQYHWNYTVPYKWKFLGYILGETGATLSVGVIMPIYFKRFVDTLTQSETLDVDIVVQSLMMLLIWIGFWSLTSILSRLVADIFVTYKNPFIIRDIENDIFKRLQGFSYSFFVSHFMGSLVAKINRFSNSYQSLSFQFTRGIYPIVLQFIFTIGVISMFSPLLAVIFFTWGVLFTVMVFFLLKWKMPLDRARATAESKTTATLADSLTNFLNAKIFTRIPHEIKHFGAVSHDKAQKMSASWMRSTVIHLLQGILVVTVQVTMLYGGIRLWQQGVMSVGTIVLIQTYLINMAAQLLHLGDILKMIYRAFADSEEMVELLETIPDILDPSKPEKCKIKKGEITFQNVNFTYKKGKKVYKDFSINIPAGQKVGLVGHSGSGKSTFTKLLLRFVDVTEGSIVIDGQDIRLITQDDLRKNIAYVPQDPILFHRSVEENISYGNDKATPKEILTAAQKAHAHEFISKLPDSYQTLVGERGVKLSGGERQRVAIARAMLKQSPILVLDEATSSLDTLSEKYIQEAFDTLMKGRTTIVVAHRLSTIKKMDRIIVFDQGCIVEEGTHDQLLKKSGTYKKLWTHQTDSFIE